MNEAEAKVEDLKLSFQSLCGIFLMFLWLVFSSIILILMISSIMLLVESAKEEVDTFEAAEKELMEIEKNLQTSESVSYSFLNFFQCFPAVSVILFSWVFIFRNQISISGEGSLWRCNENQGCRCYQRGRVAVSGAWTSPSGTFYTLFKK